MPNKSPEENFDKIFSDYKIIKQRGSHFQKKYPAFFADGAGAHLYEEYQRKANDAIAEAGRILLDGDTPQDAIAAYSRTLPELEIQLKKYEKPLARHVETQLKARAAGLKKENTQLNVEKSDLEKTLQALEREQPKQTSKLENAQAAIHGLEEAQRVLSAQVPTVSEQERATLAKRFAAARQALMESVEPEAIYPKSLEIPHSAYTSPTDYCQYALEEYLVGFRHRLLAKTSDILDKILQKKQKLMKEHPTLVEALDKLSHKQRENFLKTLTARIEDATEAARNTCRKQISENFSVGLRLFVGGLFAALGTAGVALFPPMGAVFFAVPLYILVTWKSRLHKVTAEALRQHIASPQFGETISQALADGLAKASCEIGRAVTETIAELLEKLKAEVKEHRQTITTLRTDGTATKGKFEACESRLKAIDKQVSQIDEDLEKVCEWLRSVPGT